MSRLTKFLKQTCLLEQARHSDSRDIQLDKFGEVVYKPAVPVKCRKEQTIQDVQTSTGAVLRSSTRYFLDNSYSVEADDRLDGRAVLTVETYVNELGQVEGYECYV